MNSVDLASMIVGQRVKTLAGVYYVAWDGEISETPVEALLEVESTPGVVTPYRTRPASDGDLTIEEEELPQSGEDLGEYGSTIIRAVALELSGGELWVDQVCILVDAYFSDEDVTIGLTMGQNSDHCAWIANLGDELYVGFGRLRDQPWVQETRVRSFHNTNA